MTASILSGLEGKQKYLTVLLKGFSHFRAIYRQTINVNLECFENKLQ